MSSSSVMALAIVFESPRSDRPSPSGADLPRHPARGFATDCVAIADSARAIHNAPLACELFRLGKRLEVGGRALLALGIDQLIKPAGDKNRHVFFVTDIFPAHLPGIEPKADAVAIARADPHQHRRGDAGVLEFAPLVQIDTKSCEIVR